MRKLTTSLLLLLPVLGISAAAQAADPASDLMKPYPPATNEMQRNVMTLPALSDEDNYRVELIIGKMMATDCNPTRLLGELREETAKGWGYPYYNVTLAPQTVSTRMACPEGSKKMRLVTLPAASEKLLRYNSKLPLVVYAPADVKVSYRVWQASDQVVAAHQQ